MFQIQIQEPELVAAVVVTLEIQGAMELAVQVELAVGVVVKNQLN